MPSHKQKIMIAAIAGLLSVTTLPAAEEKASESMGRCLEANGCKGQSDCATKTNSCQGKNKCKAQGWKKTTQADCRDKSGKAGKWEAIKG